MNEVINNLFKFLTTPGIIDLFLIITLVECFISGFVTRLYYQITYLFVFIILAIVLGIWVAPLLGDFVNNNLMDIMLLSVNIGDNKLTSITEIWVFYGKQFDISGGLVHALIDESGKAFGLGMIGLILFLGTPLLAGLVYGIVRIFIKQKHFRYNKRWAGGLVALLRGFTNIILIQVSFGAVAPIYTYLLKSLSSIPSSGFDISVLRFMSMFDPSRSYVFGWLGKGGGLIQLYYDKENHIVVEELMDLAKKIVIKVKTPPLPKTSSYFF